jgi:hypothetical protein
LNANLKSVTDHIFLSNGSEDFKLELKVVKGGA